MPKEYTFPLTWYQFGHSIGYFINYSLEGLLMFGLIVGSYNLLTWEIHGIVGVILALIGMPVRYKVTKWVLFDPEYRDEGYEGYNLKHQRLYNLHWYLLAEFLVGVKKGDDFGLPFKIKMKKNENSDD